MSGDLVRILTTPDVFEGMIVRSRLEDEGIPVMTSGDDSPYRVGPVHVFVPVEFEVQARLVIETVRSGASALEPGAEGRDDAEPLEPWDAPVVDQAEREERG